MTGPRNLAVNQQNTAGRLKLQSQQTSSYIINEHLLYKEQYKYKQPIFAVGVDSVFV